MQLSPFSHGVSLYGATYAIIILATLAWLLSPGSRSRSRMTAEQVLVFYSAFLVSFIVGARLWHVLSVVLFAPHTQSKLELPTILSIFDLREGGVSFHGGFALACLGCAIALRSMHINMMRAADELSLFAPTIFALGRLASFTAGSPGAGPWQLMEAAGLVLVQVAMLVAFTRGQRSAGFYFWTFALGYSTVRLIAESARPLIHIWGLTIPQWASLVVAPIALWQLRVTSRAAPSSRRRAA